MKINKLVTNTLSVLAVLGLFMVTTSQPANAHQSPGSCNSNSLFLTLTKNKTVVRQGDTITFSVYLQNIDNGSSIACDVTDTTVSITLPAADGTPTGQVVTLATNADYLAGSPSALVGTANYVVNVNPGVTDAVAKGSVSGTLHDAPVDHAALSDKTVGTDITQPHVKVEASTNPSSGEPPLTTTREYEVTNDSTTDAPITNVSVTDKLCAPIVFTGGDSNSNSLLDVGEVWTYTCQQTITRAGSYTTDITVTGVNTADGGAITPATTTLSFRIAMGLPGLPKTGIGK